MPYAQFQPGDGVPWFTAMTNVNPKFHFETVAGLYIVLCFVGSAAGAGAAAAVKTAVDNIDLFDDQKICLFAVSVDPTDSSEGRLKPHPRGIRYIWDGDMAVSRLYGAVETEKEVADGRVAYRQFWMVLDPMQRMMAQFPIERSDAVMEYLRKLPSVATHAGVELPAPVLVAPRIFEPEFCRHLIGLYQKNGGHDSGFMRDVDGKTVGVIDHSFKRRADYYINDERTLFAAKSRIERRLLPLIEKAFQYSITRMERYLVCCYDAEGGGYFMPHRDNTTKGTAHRKFAVTINLNADEYEGGDLRFPEFGPRSYRAPTGGAVVFSCSLLHEAMPVKKGLRYAFLPFLYDEAGSKVRAENNKFLGDGIQTYNTGDASKADA